MPINIIGTEKFQTNLERWLLKNDQGAGDTLFQMKGGIPLVFRNYSKKLYRGMTVDDAFIEKAYNGRYTFDRHTAWTKDIKIARKFIDDPAYMLGNASSSTKYKIIITKVVAQRDIILDIDSFVTFMGIKQLEMIGYDETNVRMAANEKEVLVSRGLSVTRADYNIIS